jgi:hypothetical protein
VVIPKLKRGMKTQKCFLLGADLLINTLGILPNKNILLKEEERKS